MTRLHFAACALAGVLLLPSAVRADPNQTHTDDDPVRSCPFPHRDADEHHRSRSTDDSARHSDDSIEVTDSGGAPCTSSGPIRPLRWPRLLGLRLSAVYASSDWAGARFQIRDSDFAAPGEGLALGRMDLSGAELGVGFEGKLLHIGLAAGIYRPVGGDDGGYLGSDTAFGRHAVSSDAHLWTTLVEAGLLHRQRRLTLYGGLYAGLTGASVTVQATCGCGGELHALRAVVGPQAGFRVRLFGSLFLGGSVRADLVRLPDYVASVGLGFAPRRF